jgi:hypothetical protein
LILIGHLCDIIEPKYAGNAPKSCLYFDLVHNSQCMVDVLVAENPHIALILNLPSDKHDQETPNFSASAVGVDDRFPPPIYKIVGCAK